MDKTIDQMIAKAKAALKTFNAFNQKQVDSITEAMCRAGVDAATRLAEMAVEETGLGKVDDKVVKNHFGSQVVYDNMKDQKSVGVIAQRDGILEIAEPFGIIAGVTPTTNPTATTMFKCLSALKGRNVIILAFHPRAQKCSAEAARILRDAAVAAGAPAECIQWIEEPSIEATNTLMTHPDISMVIATGGGAMVRAAYSSGHPALGVGPGNVPVYIEKTANLNMAVEDIIASKTFDYGTLCLTEQSVIFDDLDVAADGLALFKEKGAYLCSMEEKTALEEIMFDKNRGVVAAQVVGQSPQKIAELAGFNIAEEVKLLLVPLTAIGPEDWMSHEKLSPVLGWYIVDGKDEAIDAAIRQLEFGGAGHTAVVFSKNEEILNEYAIRVPAGRVIFNQPSMHGVVGLYSAMTPSFTLGCGARGGNITAENITFKHLLNIKRAARRLEPEPVAN